MGKLYYFFLSILLLVASTSSCFAEEARNVFKSQIVIDLSIDPVPIAYDGSPGSDVALVDSSMDFVELVGRGVGASNDILFAYASSCTSAPADNGILPGDGVVTDKIFMPKKRLCLRSATGVPLVVGKIYIRRK